MISVDFHKVSKISLITFLCIRVEFNHKHLLGSGGSLCFTECPLICLQFLFLFSFFLMEMFRHFPQTPPHVTAAAPFSPAVATHD